MHTKYEPSSITSKKQPNIPAEWATHPVHCQKCHTFICFFPILFINLSCLMVDNMTYLSCCGKGNDMYMQRNDPFRDVDFSVYAPANGNHNYDAGINKVAGAYMQTPSCGSYKSGNNLLL